MFKNDVINCVREHLDKWYATSNHNETACQLVDEYEEHIRADERAKTIDEIGFKLCSEVHFGYEVEARVVEVLEQMKGVQND